MPVCGHCGEMFPEKRLNCPHCGADADVTWSHEGEYHEELQDFDDEAEYREFLVNEGLEKPVRKGCVVTLLTTSGLIWILL